MTDTITERVTSITDQTDEAVELSEQSDRIDRRRSAAQLKNQEFGRLESTLNQFHSDYRTFNTWRRLADEMGVEYESEAIDEVVSEVERNLQTVLNRSFEDFEDESEIEEVRSDVEEHARNLDSLQSTVQTAVETECEELLDELGTKRTVLRIPDVGTVTDETTVEELQEFLRNHRDGNLQNDAPARYRELADEYDDVEISFDAVQSDYGIGDEAMEELRKLLRNQTVTLGEIDEDVLRDLKNLTEFSKLLTIQFKEEQ